MDLHKIALLQLIKHFGDEFVACITKALIWSDQVLFGNMRIITLYICLCRQHSLQENHIIYILLTTKLNEQAKPGWNSLYICIIGLCVVGKAGESFFKNLFAKSDSTTVRTDHIVWTLWFWTCKLKAEWEVQGRAISCPSLAGSKAKLVDVKAAES